ncbi:MAG: GNAT family N-acetyltransferase [Trueperaceae bacterium]|nr:GNAT family N-acetyltransferase [Trueperaceae bacterium]
MFELPVNERLKLELLEPGHASELYMLVDANRDHLGTWMPWVENTKSTEDILNFIKSGLNNYAMRNGFQLGLRFEQKLAGVLGLHYIDWDTGATEMGYWLDKKLEGKGLMTAAVSALLEKLFNHYKLNRVEIRANPANTRSRAIPKRLGFLEEGMLRQTGMNAGERFDMVVYGLLKEEWQLRRED